MEGSETIPPGSTAQVGGKRDAPDKVCYICRQAKPATLEYYYLNTPKTGLSSYCKPCHKEHTYFRTLARRFSLSREQYDALLAKQGGRCPICECKFSSSIKIKIPSVDHCHKTGRVRGLLCRLCNAGIGSLKDSSDRLRRAIQYLQGDDIVPTPVRAGAVSKETPLE